MDDLNVVDKEMNPMEIDVHVDALPHN